MVMKVKTTLDVRYALSKPSAKKEKFAACDQVHISPPIMQTRAAMIDRLHRPFPEEKAISSPAHILFVICFGELLHIRC